MLRPADEEVAASVELAKRISMSSLGTPQAREARLTGRKETERHLASEIGSTGPVDDAVYDEALDLAVADELEVRGYTFEAELRYRRLAAHSPTAMIRLAPLLEMKGLRDEAWRLYLRAAQHDEPTALLRLAVICCQRGEQSWALRLIRHAYAQLAKSTRSHMLDQVDRTCQYRRQSDLAGKIATAANALDIDSVFALGSFFFVVAGRSDLTRLTYSSALARGHSLAGVSLLDMTPRRGDFSGMGESGYLEMLLDDGLNVSRYKQYDSGRNHDGATLESYALLLSNNMQKANFDQLHDALGRPSGDPDAADALERVLLNAQLFTTFLGYRRFGVHETLDAVRTAGDSVCEYVAGQARSRVITSGRQLINTIWHQTDLELNQISEQLQREKRYMLCGSHPPRFNQRKYPKFVRGSGMAARLGTAYVQLSLPQARVLTQRVCGLYHDEVADAMSLSIEDTRELHRSSVRSLREAQQGEQIPTADQLLWEEIESSFRDNSDPTSDPDRPPSYHPITGPEGPVPIERLDSERGIG